MPRIARVVAPGLPHHVTQRGNRRQRTFFARGDYAAYVALMAEWCGKLGNEVWAYCLMDNHVHLVVTPASAEGLRVGIGEAHRRYTRRINSRKGWCGHLWQGRFASYVMDEAHLLAAVRYAELNPVRAGLVGRAGDWPWSSASAHLAGLDDDLVRVAPMLSLVSALGVDWLAYLRQESPSETLSRLGRCERTGRPAGGDGFIARLERTLGRPLSPNKTGRPRKAQPETRK